MTPKAEITYGPTYQDQMTAFLGVSLRGSRVIAACPYLAQTWEARKLDDGRVIWIINRMQSDNVYIFADYAEFQEARRKFDAGLPDPETMRRY